MVPRDYLNDQDAKHNRRYASVITGTFPALSIPECLRSRLMASSMGCFAMLGPNVRFWRVECGGTAVLVMGSPWRALTGHDDRDAGSGRDGTAMRRGGHR